jgi:hypothetical protein
MEVSWDFIFLLLNKKWELKNVNNFKKIEIPEKLKEIVQDFIKVTKDRKDIIKRIEILENLIKKHDEMIKLSNKDDDKMEYLVLVEKDRKVLMNKTELNNFYSLLKEDIRERIQFSQNEINNQDKILQKIKKVLNFEYERFIDYVIENASLNENDESFVENVD